MQLADAPARDVRPLLREERAALVALLRSFGAREWDAPSPCPGWSARDVAAHVLGEDLGLLARDRDGHRGVALPAGGDYRDFVAALNAANQRWVEAARRLSGRQLVDLLESSGEELAAWWANADLAAPATVSWAGPAPVPAWFDVARHYTERWVHQQQIREAAGRPGLDGAEYLGPVLATFVWALPHHYRDVAAPAGTELAVVVTGPGGGRWALTRRDHGWELEEAAAGAPDAVVRLASGAAWRLFTAALEDDGAVTREGPAALTEPFLTARAIIV